MYSLSFPTMFSSVKTHVLKDHDATLSNLRLLLLSEKGTLFGDPYYGTRLKRLIYEQNNQILRDLVIDDIYTAILTSMPQLQLTRKNITVTSDKANVYAKIECINRIDYQVDTYEINLTSSGYDEQG